VNTLDYIHALADQYRRHANPTYAEAMRWYMKYNFDFFGIKTPARRVIDKAFVAQHGSPSVEMLHEMLPELWQMTEREFHYFAVELAARCRFYRDENALSVIEMMITQRSWWDAVDAISTELVAPYFRAFPAKTHEIAHRWIESDNMWLQRTAIIFQRKHKQQTDTDLLFELVARRADSEEFFIRKGIGWALREYAKTNPEAVRTFVAAQPLSALSRREALRRLPPKAPIPDPSPKGEGRHDKRRII
jgi:3-methyladenine DNA glycosylase AlkD